MATSVASCPVCSEFHTDPIAFALHVVACTTPSDAAASTPTPTPTKKAAATPTPTPAASCPMCHAVYTREMATHEIEFHEEECERVNEYIGPVVPMTVSAALGGGGGAGRGPTSGAKRTRDSAASSSAAGSSAATLAAGSKVTLYPANCAVCDSGGRTLLHCAGTCARSFHPLCIEELNVAKTFATSGRVVATSASGSGGGESATPSALLSPGGNVSFATAITRDKKAQKLWVCGECTRGLHTCQLCGFLGHAGHEIVPCSLPDCGLFFHTACLRDQNHRVQRPLICPRHTCSACHAIETDMTVCSSCAKCCKSIHIRCRDALNKEGAAATSGTQTRGRGDVLDPNFHICDAHKPHANQSVVAATNRKLAQFVGLKMHSRPGDIVMILEYGNLLLPDTAKTAAPLAYNQWGIVQRVENLGDGASSAWWTQLLTVVLFSDNSAISVPNQYVLPLATIRQYSSPTSMVRDAIKWHAMNEVHARHLEKQKDAAAVASAAQTQSAILPAVVLAFRERANALGLSATDCLAYAGDGFQEWQAFLGAAGSSYEETAAPVYVALDTRGKNKPVFDASSINEQTQRISVGARESMGDDGDVDMASATGSAQGDSDTSMSNSIVGRFRTAAQTTQKEPVEGEVVEVMARLVESVEAGRLRGVLLGGSLATRVNEVDQSLNNLVSHMEVDDDDVDDNGDIEMESAMDQQSAEREGDDSHGYENRLSIDDLLYPLNQDSVVSPAIAPAPPLTDTMDGGIASVVTLKSMPETYPSEAADANSKTATQKRPHTTSSKKERVYVLDVMGQSNHIEPASKKPKLNHDMKPPVAVHFSQLPVKLNKPSGSVFSRTMLPGKASVSHKDKLTNEVRSTVLRELNRQVDAFFGAEDESGHWGFNSVPSIRPAFYRPTPFLYRGARADRRVDAISRVLLCQDKRNLKCFVREATSVGTTRPSKSSCPFKPTRDGRTSYVSVDLMGIPNFLTLEKEVRGRIVNALLSLECPPPMWSVASQSTEAVSDPEIHLSYCVYDGSEHTLSAKNLDKVQQPEWLCFCANVVHLTATVMPQH